MYYRTDALIPFQPVESIVQDRQRYLDAASNFPASSGPEWIDPLDAILVDLDAISLKIENDAIPTQASSLALQQLRTDLNSLGIGAATEDRADDEGFWSKWLQANEKLESTEGALLGHMYLKLHIRCEEWLEQVEESSQDYEQMEIVGNAMQQAGETMLALIDAGYAIKAEMLPYVEASVDLAESDHDLCSNSLTRLERMHAWLQNRYALALCLALSNNGSAADLPPMQKLRQLAKCDQRHFVPYVYQRFEESWNEYMAELDENEMVEATMLRVMGDAQ